MSKTRIFRTVPVTERVPEPKEGTSPIDNIHLGLLLGIDSTITEGIFDPLERVFKVPQVDWTDITYHECSEVTHWLEELPEISPKSIIIPKGGFQEQQIQEFKDAWREAVKDPCLNWTITTTECKEGFSLTPEHFPIPKTIDELLIEVNQNKIFEFDSIDLYYDWLKVEKNQHMVVKYTNRMDPSPEKSALHFRSSSFQESLAACLSYLKLQQANQKPM